MILILIPLQYEGDGMRICAKHSNFIQSGNDSLKTPFLVVFGYNNCSVSNPNDCSYLFKITMMKSGYAQNTKFLFRAEIIPRKHRFWSYLAITIAVCQIQMILTLLPFQNEYDWMEICANQKFFIQRGNNS